MSKNLSLVSNKIKQLPNNIEAEQAVIGSVLTSNEIFDDISSIISEINFYDHGVQLTRRFRALKFYMSIKTFGLQAFRKAVTYNIQLAEATEKYLRKSARWEVISSATLAVINFRYNPIKEALSEKELDQLNQYISEKVVVCCPCWCCSEISWVVIFRLG